MHIATLIIADENEGRRNLLANTFEREGFEVTRLSTLGQAEATALGVFPDVLLLEGEWSQGSALEVCQTLNGQPKFRNTSRTVVLSRTTAPDFLSSAAMAGVSEVIGKPIDMNMLVSQIRRHATKQFVPPPAEIAAPQAGTFGGQRFNVNMTMNDSKWALPMLRRLVEAGNIDNEFVADIQAEMEHETGVDEDEKDTNISPEMLTEMVRLALNRLVGSTQEAVPKPAIATESNAPSISDLNKGATLGEGATTSKRKTKISDSMEDILERQAEDIAEEVETSMDEILDERPEYVSLLEENEQVGIDPETLKLTRLTSELVHELMQALQRPGALSDLTLLTQVEDASGLMGDVLQALPVDEEE